jgi:hypothetical protein
MYVSRSAAAYISAYRVTFYPASGKSYCIKKFHSMIQMCSAPTHKIFAAPDHAALSTCHHTVLYFLGNVLTAHQLTELNSQNKSNIQNLQAAIRASVLQTVEG